MKNKEKLIELAYDYVIKMSTTKKYNPQTISNASCLRRYDKEKILKILSEPVEEFCRLYDPCKVRDFVYKSDYFTPRKMYLINPLYYTYYTYLVFQLSRLFLKNNFNLDFSRERMSLFYSGFLDLDPSKEDIDKYAMYNESYKSFQKERESYFGNSVLKIDIQDFFNSIRINDLILKLRKLLGNKKIIDDLEYFFNFCGFDSLPQLHYSIASSILSQFYLVEFDLKIQEILERENFWLLRFVDDMYIVDLDQGEDKSKFNNVLNVISYYLWEDSLVLNTSKTKILTPEQYQNGYELFLSDYGYDESTSSFTSEKLVEERAMEVIEEGNLLFLVQELCKLEKENGIDLVEYKRLIKEYISIKGEDENKVLNNIIFSRKWKDMDKKNLKKLIRNWKYILFNPSQFTILYIMVYRFLEKEKVVIDNGKKIKTILNYLFRNDIFTFRDTLVAVSYLFQSGLKNKKLLYKIEKVNPGYVEFLETFVLDNY
ncbi:hypothetical protein [Brevibacillus reuszeri]|uniref:hypothetical protein n=1 Tax=Brevibacillus reuszeri TaxID=54915 RepID=UPI000CCC47D4|nr:hypothetical protein [Brevibacillus reuszeri]